MSDDVIRRTPIFSEAYGFMHAVTIIMMAFSHSFG